MWVFVFLGQGVQVIGMGCDLVEVYFVVCEVFVEVDVVLGEDLFDLIWNGDIDMLMLMQNVQLVLMVILIVVLWVLEVEGFGIGDVVFVVGYSLGEYFVLCVVGVLSFVDMVWLLWLCGQVMQEVVLVGVGVMVVIFGLDFVVVEDLVCEVVQGEVCQVVNDNDLVQVVVLGYKGVVEWVVVLVKEWGVKWVLMLLVLVLFYLVLMQFVVVVMVEVLVVVEIVVFVVLLVVNVCVSVVIDLVEIW